MLLFGSFVQDARAPAASAAPPPVMFAAFTVDQVAVALLLQRQRLLLMFPQSGDGWALRKLSRSTGWRSPAGLPRGIWKAPALNAARYFSSSRGCAALPSVSTSGPNFTFSRAARAFSESSPGSRTSTPGLT